MIISKTPVDPQAGIDVSILHRQPLQEELHHP